VSDFSQVAGLDNNLLAKELSKYRVITWRDRQILRLLTGFSLLLRTLCQKERARLPLIRQVKSPCESVAIPI